MGWPINRLLPWPIISSGCSLAIAARTACSTSPASRTFRVSTIAPHSVRSLPPCGGGLGRGVSHEFLSSLYPPLHLSPSASRGCPTCVKLKCATGVHTGCGEERADCAYTRNQQLSSSEPRKFGERELAAMDMHAAKFGAAMQGRKYLAGIEQALRVEGAFQPLLLVEIDLAEHLRHQVALLDADAMLAGEDAAEFDADP